MKNNIKLRRNIREYICKLKSAKDIFGLFKLLNYPNNIIGFQGMSINKYYRELINRISVLRKYMKMKGISNKRRKIINYDSWSKILKYRDDLKEILSEKREISPIFILPEEKADNLYRKLSNMPNIPDLLSEDTSDCILDIKTLKKILT